MSNNVFYKALAAVSTVGIVVIAGIQVTTTLKEGNTKVQLDFLGREPIKGWRVVENRPENTIYYVNHKNIEKVKARGLRR